MPTLLDLPGPSRRVRVEPLRLPVPERVPMPAAPEPREPAQAPPAEREPQPARSLV
jgi:hypothetical protein